MIFLIIILIIASVIAFFGCRYLAAKQPEYPNARVSDCHQTHRFLLLDYYWIGTWYFGIMSCWFRYQNMKNNSLDFKKKENLYNRTALFFLFYFVFVIGRF
ncbi:hypothetical protein [Kingella potus]|uniref:hypothetical protein n=1 Tax=Kingella potus TaxID=265175 RepID=UPI001FD126F3|nr:hypothetical protein [Kingella potus]UOP01437.1 hypothetical protein LVJ84_04310 [Kingella potus]